MWEWVKPLLHRYSFLTHQQQTAFENIVGKEEIARNEQFLLFPECFLLNQKIVSSFVNIYDIMSLFAAELEGPIISIWGKWFRYWSIMGQWTRIFSDQVWIPLEQLVSQQCVCVNFRVLKNCCLWKDRKYGRNRRKYWLPLFSPFPKIFSKGLSFRVVKTRDCVIGG